MSRKTIRDKVNDLLVRADNLRLDSEFDSLDDRRRMAVTMFIAKLKEANQAEAEGWEL